MKGNLIYLMNKMLLHTNLTLQGYGKVVIVIDETLYSFFSRSTLGQDSPGTVSVGSFQDWVEDVHQYSVGFAQYAKFCCTEGSSYETL